MLSIMLTLATSDKHVNKTQRNAPSHYELLYSVKLIINTWTQPETPSTNCSWYLLAKYLN